MTLPVTITCAPCCWGVDDVSNPHLPHWERVLDEAAEAGFGGLELGPYGYMPLDVARVGAALEARGLRIVAGTIFDDLVSPRNRENLLRQVRRDLRAHYRRCRVPKLIAASASLRRTSL